MSNFMYYCIGNQSIYSPRESTITRADGGCVHLTRTENSLLNCLLLHAESKDEIIATVWKSAVVSESSYYKLIHDLRDKFDKAGLSKNFVKTVPRRGCILTVDALPFLTKEEAFNSLCFLLELESPDTSNNKPPTNSRPFAEVALTEFILQESNPSPPPLTHTELSDCSSGEDIAVEWVERRALNTDLGSDDVASSPSPYPQEFLPPDLSSPDVILAKNKMLFPWPCFKCKAAELFITVLLGTGVGYAISEELNRPDNIKKYSNKILAGEFGLSAPINMIEEVVVISFANSSKTIYACKKKNKAAESKHCENYIIFR